MKRLASSMVNHAPSGTLVSAEERNLPSRQAMMKTKYGFMRQTRMATKVTMHVSKKVTNMTQTPYAFPREVVLL